LSLLALMLTGGLVLALWAAPGADAVPCSKTWNGNTANWNTAGEWTPSGVPDTGDVVCINSGQPTLSGTGATIAGLDGLKDPALIARLRGKDLEELAHA